MFYGVAPPPLDLTSSNTAVDLTQVDNIKNIVEKAATKTGTTITTANIENISTKRPETGISPLRLDEIIRKKANKNYNYDDLIEE